MPDTVYKMTKLVGESPTGIEAAVRAALETSGERVRHQTWAHVVDIRASLGEGGAVEQWQVGVEVAFEVER